MKAWRVTEIGYEECCAIVFTDTRGKAKSEGAAELDREFMEVSIRREKRYDQYAERGYVPLEVLISDSWWFTCGCGERVDEESLAEGGKIIDEHVYCPKCAKERDQQCQPWPYSVKE